ncbi:MAG: hypothetical protein AAF651_14200 [Cyanobacteria bacterium P01_C01_bin.73]
MMDRQKHMASLSATVAAIAALTMAQVPSAIAREPDDFCYMRTSSGRLVNLGDICGVEPVVSSSSSPAAVAPSPSSPSPSALNSPEDFNAFMVGCTESVLADGGTPAEADQFCGCAARGLQTSGLSNEQLLTAGDAFTNPAAPAPDLETQNVFGEVVLACLFTGGLAF